MDVKDTPEVNYYPINTKPEEVEKLLTNTPATPTNTTNVVAGPSGSILNGGTLTSPNFSAGNVGWRLDSNGNIEANNGNFRGDVTGASGIFSGTLDVGGDDASSFHIDSGGGIWSGASVANKATAPFRVSSAGALASTSGAIGGWTIDSTSIYTGTEDHSGYTANAGDLTIYSDGSNASIHAKEFYIDANGAIFATSVTLSGAITTGVGSSIASDYLSGIIAQANLNVSNRGWSQTCAFSVTDADTVAWGSGTLTSADGTAYSITGANTGNMTLKTYIYLDTAVSTTAYQITTTAATAVGVGKVLVAIAQNGTTEATYKVMDGQGGENIDAANIVAGSITANEIAASTITAGKMSVSTLSSIIADLGAITAGTITVDTAGYIRGGQTAYNTGTGFFLGYSTDAYKFSIGVPTGNYLLWTGSGISVRGPFSSSSTLTAGETINGATLPVAVYQNPSDNEIYACDADDATKLKFLGFAITNSTDGNPIEIQLDGTVTGFSGLTSSVPYYVQDDKTIGSTPGTYPIQVGIATSASQIVVYPEDVGTRWVVIASENLKYSADAESWTTNNSLTKFKEIKVNYVGTVTVKFSIKYVTGAGDFQIYVNGVAAGTQRTPTTSYVEFSENITIAAGDLIQLYLVTWAAGTKYCKNFRVYYDKVSTPDGVVTLNSSGSI